MVLGNVVKIALVFLALVVAADMRHVDASASAEAECQAGLAELDLRMDCPTPGEASFRTATGGIVEYTFLSHDDVGAADRLDELCLNQGGGDGTPYLLPCVNRPPFCVGDPMREHHYRLVYAHPAGTPNRSLQFREMAWSLFERANGAIDYEAQLFGIRTDLKAACYVAGPWAGRPTFDVIEYEGAVFGHPAMQEPNARYMVLVDGPGRTSSGWIADDSPGLENEHNSAPNWGYVFSPREDNEHVSFHGSFLHELGHGLGAVNSHAPHSLPGAHCGDGRDIMCYDPWVNERPPGTVPTNVVIDRVKRLTPTQVPLYCSDYLHFDCNHDDYFNPAPEPSPVPGVVADNYLFDHWNIGDPANLFIRFSSKHDPAAVIVAPGNGTVNAPVTFNGTSSSDADGDDLSAFLWDFGDNATAEGAVVDHAYAGAGTYIVRLTVYDEYEGWAAASVSITVAEP